MDIQRHLENSLVVVRSEPLVVIGGGLLTVLLNLVSFGILSGPLLGGYLLMMILVLREGRKPEFNDLFAGFARFGQLFPFIFLSVLIVVGFIFMVVPGIVMMTWWIYVLMLMTDKEMPLGRAMTVSRLKVTETGFFMHLVFAFMITLVPTLLINFAAAVFPPLKAFQIILLPFQCACLASLYLEQFPSEDETEKQGDDNNVRPSFPPPEPPHGNGNTEKSESLLPPPPPEQNGA